MAILLHIAVEATPIKHGVDRISLAIGSTKYPLVSVVSSFEVTVAARNLIKRVCTHMSVSPPLGM